MQRLLTQLRNETDAVSDNSNMSSYDSGQGDHDDQEATQDGYAPQHCVPSSSCPRLSTLSPPSGQGKTLHVINSHMSSDSCA